MVFMETRCFGYVGSFVMDVILMVSDKLWFMFWCEHPFYELMCLLIISIYHVFWLGLHLCRGSLCFSNVAMHSFFVNDKKGEKI